MSVAFFRQIFFPTERRRRSCPTRCFKCNEVKAFESHYYSAPPPNEETMDGIRLFDAVQNSARAIVGLGEASGMAIEKLERKIELLETHSREHGKRIDAIMIRLLNLERWKRIDDQIGENQVKINDATEKLWSDVAKLKAWREEEEKRLAEIVGGAQ